MYPWGAILVLSAAILVLSATWVSITFMLCFVLGKYGVFGRNVDVEQNFVEMGDRVTGWRSSTVWEQILCYL